MFILSFTFEQFVIEHHIAGLKLLKGMVILQRSLGTVFVATLIQRYTFSLVLK